MASADALLLKHLVVVEAASIFGGHASDMECRPMNPQPPADDQLRGLTVAEVAHRYVQAQLRGHKVNRWQDLREAYGEDAWICEGVYDGGELWDQGRLSNDVWFDLIAAAADLALSLEPADRYAILFNLGDGCSDHLVWRDAHLTYRFQEARRKHPGVEAMFGVMHDEAEGTDFEHTTWWRNSYPIDRPESPP